jgi:hypothetical protein
MRKYTSIIFVKYQLKSNWELFEKICEVYSTIKSDLQIWLELAGSVPKILEHDGFYPEVMMNNRVSFLSFIL